MWVRGDPVGCIIITMLLLRSYKREPFAFGKVAISSTFSYGVDSTCIEMRIRLFPEDSLELYS